MQRSLMQPRLRRNGGYSHDGVRWEHWPMRDPLRGSMTGPATRPICGPSTLRSVDSCVGMRSVWRPAALSCNLHVSVR